MRIGRRTDQSDLYIWGKGWVSSHQYWNCIERRTIQHHKYKRVQHPIAHSMCHDHHMYWHCNHLEIGEEILFIVSL